MTFSKESSMVNKVNSMYYLLLFAAGTIAGMEAFHVTLLLLIFFSAAVIEDTINDIIGKKAGSVITETSLLGKFIDQTKLIKPKPSLINMAVNRL